MMVETILESSQDFAGMSNGSLPQWKRELLQRRLARGRPGTAPTSSPPSPPPPPPPPPPRPDEDEELRYGPGIVKRLKSRYLSLALRDAPRRRPSVLRRAASLEHLLDARPPPAPRAPRAPRPASLAAAPLPPPPPPHARRDLVKRARSVDALSRLDSREDVAPPPSPSPPPAARAPRPPRRPQPLLRDAERPPPDVVRSTLRKFESAPPRRAAPAARLSAVLRGLDPRRSVTPDGGDAPRTPSPQTTAETLATPPSSPPPPPVPETPVPSLPTKALSPVSLAPAPSITRTALPLDVPPTSPRPECEPASPSPPQSPVPTISPAPRLEQRTIHAPLKPVQAPIASSTPKPAPRVSVETSPAASPPPPGALETRVVSRAALEGIARAGCSVRYEFRSGRGAASHLPPLAATNPVLAARGLRRVGVIRPMPPAEARLAADASKDAEARPSPPSPERAPLPNGHSTPEGGAASRIGAAGIERAWSGSPSPKPAPPSPSPLQTAPWARGGGGGGRGGRVPPPAATSVVFNFSNRKEVPDYIENDGIILRANRRNRIKAGETGVVVLRPEALTLGTGGHEGEEGGEECDGTEGPPSPCDVRFVNDNVLINGKSSLLARCGHSRDRLAKLKLQFDDSLTRTFEYPSETSLCEEAAPPSPPDGGGGASLADNTHLASAALSCYTPSKTCAASFQLGLANPRPESPPPAVNGCVPPASGGEEGDARPCGADVAKSWSDARAHRTDLLF